MRALTIGTALILLSAPLAHAKTITLVATTDGEVSDQESLDGSLISDGIFETVNEHDDFLELQRSRFERTSHGIFEFDLGALPDNALITKGEFIFHVFTAGLQPPVLDFFGGDGDGQITLDDATRTAAALGSIALPTGLPALDNDHVVDLGIGAAGADRRVHAVDGARADSRGIAMADRHVHADRVRAWLDCAAVSAARIRGA